MRELAPGDPELIGPYRLRGRLGAGGMGRVYLGLSPGGRAVAVKVIRADLAQDAEFLARFRREVAVARTVSGLFTAPVIDADVDGPVPWLATAYVPGPSLADAVSEHGPLPAASVLALARGLAGGCLAKDPALRPTAADLLAAAASPAAGWLPEPVTRALAVPPPTRTAPRPAAPASVPALVSPVPGSPPAADPGRPPRRVR